MKSTRIVNLNVKGVQVQHGFLNLQGRAEVHLQGRPAGYMYLQKNGSPMPSEFVTNAGSSITKTTRITYFQIPQRFHLCSGKFFARNLMQQILKPSERAEKATDKPSQQNSQQDKKPVM